MSRAAAAAVVGLVGGGGGGGGASVADSSLAGSVSVAGGVGGAGVGGSVNVGGSPRAAAASSSAAAARGRSVNAAGIPRAVTVETRKSNTTKSNTKRSVGAVVDNKSNSLWGDETDDDGDADGKTNLLDGSSKAKRQRIASTNDANANATTGAAATNAMGPPPPPPPPQSRHPKLPSRTEMVRSEMASFVKQQRYRSELQQTKTSLLHALQMTGGDVTTEPFLHALKRLRGLYKRSGLDCRRAVTGGGNSPTAEAATANAATAESPSAHLEGMWLTLSRPNYHDCLGLNPQREYMYTLGRMSFGMYRPTNLVCSVQGVFNPVHVVDVRDRDEVESVPRGLRRELYEGRTLLRTYNIVTAFSIEPPSPLFGDNSPNSVVVRPIRGIMTTYGYVLPDPGTPNRLSVWFTGGTVEVDDEGDSDEWRRIFGDDDAAAAAAATDAGASQGSGGGGPMAPPRPGPSLSERAKLLAAKLLLGATVPQGMEEDGSMNFQLRRPVGGHGSAYVDILYLDDTLRIMQGHHGSVYVMARVPGS